MAWTNTLQLAEHPIILELDDTAVYGDINDPLFYRAVKALREAQAQFPDNKEDAAAAIWSTAVSHRSLLVDWLEKHDTSIETMIKFARRFPNEKIKGTDITYGSAEMTDALLMHYVNARGQHIM